MRRYSVWKFLTDAIILLSVVVIGVALSGGFVLDPAGPFRLSVHDYDRAFYVFCLMSVLRLILSAKPGGGLTGRLNDIIDKVGFVVDRIKPVRCILVLAVMLCTFLILSPAIRYFQFGDMPDFCIHVEVMHSFLRGEMFLDPFNYKMFHSLDMGFDIPDPRVCAFADHFKPLIFLYVPVFKLFPSAITLLVIQALLIVSGVFPLYILARDRLKNERWALAVVACYCCYPPVLGTAWSFFPSVVSMSFLLWAFLMVSRKRFVAMWFFLLLTLAAKETMALPVLSFGAYLFLIEKKRIHGVVVASVALFWLIVCLHWVIPSFAPDGQYPYFKLYSDRSSSLFGMIVDILMNPVRLFQRIFSETIFHYLLGLLMSVAFLPLVGWRIWILSFPILAQNILSLEVYVYPSWPAGLWSAPIVPFTFLAVIFGLAGLRRRYSSNVGRYAVFLMLLLSLMCLPVSRHKGIWTNSSMNRLTEYLENTLPSGSRVSTNIMIAWPRWSLRYRLSSFPFNLADYDYVVLRLSNDVVEQYEEGLFEQTASCDDELSEASLLRVQKHPLDSMDYYRLMLVDGEFVKKKVFHTKNGYTLIVLERSKVR